MKRVQLVESARLRPSELWKASAADLQVALDKLPVRQSTPFSFPLSFLFWFFASSSAAILMSDPGLPVGEAIRDVWMAVRREDDELVIVTAGPADALFWSGMLSDLPHVSVVSAGNIADVASMSPAMTVIDGSLSSVAGVDTLVRSSSRVAWLLSVPAGQEELESASRLVWGTAVPDEHSFVKLEHPDDTTVSRIQAIRPLMSPEQLNIYKLAIEDYQTTVNKAAALGWPGSSPAQLRHGLFVRLRQIASGFVGWRDEEGAHIDPMEIEQDVKRLWLMEFFNRLSGQQVIVATEFLYSGYLVYKLASDMGFSCVWSHDGEGDLAVKSKWFMKGGTQIFVHTLAPMDGKDSPTWPLGIEAPYRVIYELPSVAHVLEQFMNRTEPKGMATLDIMLAVRGSLEEAMMVNHREFYSMWVQGHIDPGILKPSVDNTGRAAQ